MKVFKKVMIIIVIIWLGIGLVLVGHGYSMYKEALKETSFNEKIASIREKDNYTKIEELPKMYLNAVISVEDHRFYNHNGIDIIAIGRAVVKDIQKMDFVEGGSTITQQLAKNIYFTQEKKITRKIAEIFMAFKIEKELEKDEILELYLNTSYFGDGYYTVKEACKGYFGKELKDMTEGEMVMLAGIPNAPSAYAPTKNMELAKKRQKQVIDKMIKYKIVTEEEADKIIKETANF